MSKSLFLLLLTLFCFYCLQAGEIERVTPSTRHLVPKGKSMDAIDGDWIMKNDKVVVVIGDALPGREVNMRVQSVQGAVIDFTSLEDNSDYLAAFYPQGYPAADSRRNPAIFADRIEVVQAKGREIILRAIRNPTSKVPYESVTEYTLIDGERFLRVKTRYSNSGNADVRITFADKLRMDMDIRDEVPAFGKHRLAFMYNKWFNSAYGVYRSEGIQVTEKPRTESDPGTGLLVVFDDARISDTTFVVLQPGQQIETQRYLLYGKDVAELQRQVAAIEKARLPITTLQITDKNKKPVGGVFAEIFNDKKELVSFAITGASGSAQLPLPAGNYRYVAARIGHDTISAAFSVAGKDITVPGTLQPKTSIIFSIKETGSTRMLPVRVEFKGRNGTRDPYLGIFKRAEGANNQYYAMKNTFEVPLPPGQYNITISHGPEYETVTQQIDINAGETKQIQAALKRSFTSAGWVIADFHNHSARSGDNDVETRSRIINLAGSGIEFAPATEHNRISSYTDEIKALGLETYLASAAGIELTGPTGVAGGPNHENAFGLTIQPGKQGGGFPPINADVYQQMKGLYDYDGGKIKYIQHNHPGMGIANLYFDKDRDGVLDSGYATRSFTNAIELQTFVFDILNVTSDSAKNKKAPVFFWLQMLNQGDRIFATMTSDSHIVGERNGLRFVYIYSKKDNPLDIDQREMVDNARNGHMVMSNGPFLKATLNDRIPGDEIKSNGGALKMNVEVYGNNEVQINRVQVLINGRQDKSLNFTAASHPGLFTKNSLQFRNSFALNVPVDAHVIVVATGKNLVSGKQVPFAVTNPFFIDVNGDGFVANKDTLGEPLPVALRTARASESTD